MYFCRLFYCPIRDHQTHKDTMKLRISNLGVIDTMEIDMSKPFILFAGDNGTGKTYVSTFLYCLLSDYVLYLVNDYFSEKQLPIRKQIKTGWDGTLDADDLYSLFENYLTERKKDVVDSMNLNIQEKSFKCEIVTTREEWRAELKKKSSSETGKNFSLSKKANTFDYSIRGKDEKSISIAQSLLVLSLYFDNCYLAYFSPAERNGIYTFSKELSVGRLRNPNKTAESRYPQPVSDGLAEAEDLVNRKKRTSPYHTLADEIEQDILHGRLSVTDEGEVLFAPTEGKNYGINEMSSAIKTLAPIIFYLRYDSNNNNVLFIDEPELNLHPKNQILVARVFGKMINAGLRLVVSTHSDYIIREINNMIMADALTKAGSDLPSQQGYDASLCLAAKKFAPYLFEAGSGKRGKVAVRPLEVDSYGFSMPSIDEAINRQNEVTESLYEVLKYDYPNK